MTTGDTAYYAMYIVGFAIMMVYDIIRCRHYSVPRSRAVIYTLLTYVYGVAGAMTMGSIYSAAAASRGSSDISRVAIFGAVIFAPLLLILTCELENLGRRLLKCDQISLKSTLDLLTPGIFIILTCAKFGCSLAGCCHGIPCSFGIYEPDLKTYVFPVQICEVVCMMLLLYLVSILESRGKLTTGMKYPVTAGLYCLCRFFWEFFRYYDSEAMRHFFLGMTLWQCCCVVIIFISLMSVFMLKKQSEKQDVRS